MFFRVKIPLPVAVIFDQSTGTIGGIALRFGSRPDMVHPMFPSNTTIMTFWLGIPAQYGDSHRLFHALVDDSSSMMFRSNALGSLRSNDEQIDVRRDITGPQIDHSTTMSSKPPGYASRSVTFSIFFRTRRRHVRLWIILCSYQFDDIAVIAITIREPQATGTVRSSTITGAPGSVTPINRLVVPSIVGVFISTIPLLARNPKCMSDAPPAHPYQPFCRPPSCLPTRNSKSCWMRPNMVSKRSPSIPYDPSN
jgi:hypothetical protein